MIFFCIMDPPPSVESNSSGTLENNNSVENNSGGTLENNSSVENNGVGTLENNSGGTLENEQLVLILLNCDCHYDCCMLQHGEL